MNICIPVTEFKGDQSTVCMHFGSAPGFVIADTETGQLLHITNQAQEHMCGSVDRLKEQKVDSVVVGGIGMGALNRLVTAGFQVLRTQPATLETILAAFKAGQLQPVTVQQTCSSHEGHHHGNHTHGGHGHGGHGAGGCGHHG